MPNLDIDIEMLLPDDVDQVCIANEDGNSYYVYTQDLLEKNCLIRYFVKAGKTKRAKPKLVISCDFHNAKDSYIFFLHYQTGDLPGPLLVFRIIIDAIEYLKKERIHVEEFIEKIADISLVFYSSSQETTEEAQREKYQEHLTSYQEVLKAIKEKRGWLN